MFWQLIKQRRRQIEALYGRVFAALDCPIVLIWGLILQQLPARMPLRLLRGPRQGMQLYLDGHRPLSEKISGPLLDRIDIRVEVPRVDFEKLADKRQVEN